MFIQIKPGGQVAANFRKVLIEYLYKKDRVHWIRSFFMPLCLNTECLHIFLVEQAKGSPTLGFNL